LSLPNFTFIFSSKKQDFMSNMVAK